MSKMINPNAEPEIFSQKFKWKQLKVCVQLKLTGSYKTPVSVDGEAGNGGRRIQLEDMMRSEASWVSELT